MHHYSSEHRNKFQGTVEISVRWQTATQATPNETVLFSNLNPVCTSSSNTRCDHLFQWHHLVLFFSAFRTIWHYPNSSKGVVVNLIIRNPKLIWNYKSTNANSMSGARVNKTHKVWVYHTDHRHRRQCSCSYPTAQHKPLQLWSKSGKYKFTKIQIQLFSVKEGP